MGRILTLVIIVIIVYTIIGLAVAAFLKANLRTAYEDMSWTDIIKYWPKILWPDIF